MSAPYVEQERRARYLHGLRPSNAQACPLVVAGKRCRVGSPDSTLCVCREHHHVLDHGRIWLDEDRRYVLTGEPYNLGAEEAAEFITDMTALGLAVTFTGTSYWNPGHALMILIRPKETRD